MFARSLFPSSVLRLSLCNGLRQHNARLFNAQSAAGESSGNGWRVGPSVKVPVRSLPQYGPIAKLLAAHIKPKDVICLYGYDTLVVVSFFHSDVEFAYDFHCRDVGAGKTTLAKHLIKALTGVPLSHIVSPTFTIDIIYDAKGVRFASSLRDGRRCCDLTRSSL